LEEVFDEAALAVAGALPRRADVLTIDLLDHAALGAGLLRAVDAAGARLLARGAAVVPRALRVRAQLLELKLPGSVAGFDLSALDQYRWYPGEERAALSSLPHRPLSAPFDVCALDLEARAARAFDAAAERRAARAAAAAAEDVEGGAEGAAAAADGSDADDAEADAGWEEDLELEIPVTAAGRWNAVAFWFDLDLGGGFAGARALTSYAPCGGASGAVLNSNEALPEAASPAASAFTSAAAEATSFGQAVQYLDGQAVEPSTTVALRARRDRGQLVFAGEPPPARPRHAAVPRWHYDMVLDAERNGAYDAAIRRAVARKRGSGFGSASTAAGPYVLDIGAGSGLLSMMAARAGAGAVAAAEVSPHMADVAEECVLANGFLGRITVLDRDARRLGVGPGLKPDGQAAELERRADVAVFEVFDSGLIGEGVLHCLAAAKARLLEPNAVLVPEAAAVFAQPIQLDRFDTLELGVAGAGVGAGAGAAVSASASSSKVASATAINVSAANAWRWRPDYEGVDLRGRRGEWLPLTAAPAPAFEFDFYAAEANMAPAERRIELTFTAPGVFNAVAFWFDLRLDAEASLTTSPYAPAGPTWQQAVQWVPEVTVQPGDTLVLTARHDTYGISFEVEADKNGGAAALATRQTGVPLVDAGWRAAHDELAGVNAQLARAVAQDPLEYRAVAAAAVAFAARPGEHGLEAAGAAEFAVKMMG
jgi:type II protein arginine methyltransferase